MRDYPNLDNYIHQRELELMYPHNNNQDENIGGGRSNVPGKPVENIAITIADDMEIQGLKKNKQIVSECLSKADNDTKVIVDELYFKKNPTLTLRGIATKLNSNRTTVSNKRTALFEAIRRKQGWY